MCQIIHNPNGNPVSFEAVDHSINCNQDGFGILFHETGEIVRAMKMERAYEFAEISGQPFTMHFRFATQGLVHKANCHPCTFRHRTGKHSLFFNGMLPSLGNRKESDTVHLARMLSILPQKHWRGLLEMTRNRYAIYCHATGETEVYNRREWREYDGVLYSSTSIDSLYWKPKREPVHSARIHSIPDSDFLEWRDYERDSCFTEEYL